MSEDKNLEIIAQCLRRVRNGLSYFAIGCLTGTVICTAIALSSRRPSSSIIGIGGAFGIGTLISGCLALKNASITSSEIYKTIQDSPENIVWVYPVGINHKVNGIKASTENAVYIHLDNGRCLQLRSIPTQDVETVLSAIKQQAPQAIYGFSEEIRIRYLQNPKSLNS